MKQVMLFIEIFLIKNLHVSAIKAGAKIMMNTQAIGLIKERDKIKGVKAKRFDEEFEIQADIVVGADGVESKIGQWAGINTRLDPKDLETCAQYTLTNIDCKRCIL